MSTIGKTEQTFELFELTRPPQAGKQAPPDDPNLLHWACWSCRRPPVSPQARQCRHCGVLAFAPGSGALRQSRPRARALWTDQGFADWLAWIAGDDDGPPPVAH